MRSLTKVLLLALVASTVCFLSFNKGREYRKDDASVNQVQGIYVFIQAKPLASYEVLGTVKKTGLVWNGKASEMQNTLLRRAKKDYPDCEGVIFDDISLDHATCIKFK